MQNALIAVLVMLFLGTSVGLMVKRRIPEKNVPQTSVTENVILAEPTAEPTLPESVVTRKEELSRREGEMEWDDKLEDD